MISIDDLFTGRHFDRIIILCVRCYPQFIGLPKVLARICAKAGLEGVTVHVPTHSFAAVWASRASRRAITAGGNVVPMRVVS